MVALSPVRHNDPSATDDAHQGFDSQGKASISPRRADPLSRLQQNLSAASPWYHRVKLMGQEAELTPAVNPIPQSASGGHQVPQVPWSHCTQIDAETPTVKESSPQLMSDIRSVHSAGMTGVPGRRPF